MSTILFIIINIFNYMINFIKPEIKSRREHSVHLASNRADPVPIPKPDSF